MTIYNYISNYIRYCRVEKENRENSILKYEDVLRKIVSIIGDIEILSINQDTILELKEEMLKQGLSDSRRALVISVLRNFLKYLKDFAGISEVYDYMKLSIPQVKSRPAEYLKEKEIDELVEMLPENTPKEKRFKALVVVLASTGARISEILGMPIDGIDYDLREATVFGKGGKYRKIYFDERALHYLNIYEKAKTIKSNFLFSNVNNGNYSGKWDKNDVNRSFRYWSKKINKRVYAHLFRKSFCVNSTHNGMSLAAVSKILGHCGSDGIRTTTRYYYCPMEDEDVKDVYHKFERKFATISSSASIKNESNIK